MPLTTLAADALGVLIIALVALTVVIGVLCIYLTVHFQFGIQRIQIPRLSFFCGPWVIRVSLIVVTIWWGLGEILRLSSLGSRLFSSELWQQNVCKFYLLSNIGFAEPSIYLILVFLLNAALLKKESGTLSEQWKKKTIISVIIFCLPIFFVQVVLILVGPKFNHEDKLAEFFTCYSSTDNGIICTYPLLSAIVLGAFDAFLISYVTYIGTRLSNSVINKILRRRIYVLIFSMFIFLPSRAILLGFSVLPAPGTWVHEALVFVSFVMLLGCTLIGICILVYFPVVDSMALKDVGQTEIEVFSFDDYYYIDSASLI